MADSEYAGAHAFRPGDTRPDCCGFPDCGSPESSPNHACPNPWHQSGYTDLRQYLVCPECPPDRDHLAVAELLQRIRDLEAALKTCKARHRASKK